MGGANSIVKNIEMARRESSKGQGLISGVNMESSAEKSIREAGAEERVASDQGRENDTRSDNSQEEKREQSFQPHSIRGLCTFQSNDILCILRTWHPAKCTCTPSTDEMKEETEERESHVLHGNMTGSVEFSKNIPVRGQPNCVHILYAQSVY